MSIHDTRNGEINYKLFDAWKSPPPKRYPSYKIRCFIFQCRDIPSADADGSSDTFISLWNPDKNKEVKTRVIEDSTNPIFFETIEIVYDYADIESAPPIVMNIWD
jgi:Ca2+-dependent lipid-binding protein